MHVSKMKNKTAENPDDDMESGLEESGVLFSNAGREFTEEFSKDDYIAELEAILKTRKGGTRLNSSIRD